MLHDLQKPGNQLRHLPSDTINQTTAEFGMDKKRLGNGVDCKDKEKRQPKCNDGPEPRIMEQEMKNSNEQR